MMRRSLPIFAFVLTLALATPAPAATKKKSTKRGSTTSSQSTAKRTQPAAPAPVDFDGRSPLLRAGSMILVDADTGEVLYERNADHPRPVASTQKLLTALLIAEGGDLGADVRVAAPDTWAEPSMLYIKPGEVYPRYKLLQILLVKSMNDVARCLARDNAGSVEAFADKMNARAQQIGMTHSNFVNPNGLPAPGQYSTARDMAKLAFVAYRNRTIRTIVSMKTLPWRYQNGRTTVFENTNRVLKNYALCNGMKTGYTEASGFCLISSATSGGRDVIAVVLGDKRDAIWTDSYRLLAWGLTSSRPALSAVNSD